MISESSITDRLGIQDLVNKYALYIDRHRIEEWVSLFTPDGILDESEFGFGTNVGHDSIRAYGLTLKDSVTYALHHITTAVIEELNETDAFGTVFSIVEARLKNGFHASYHVVNDDHYVKVGGKWLLKARVQRKTFEPMVFANPENVPA